MAIKYLKDLMKTKYITDEHTYKLKKVLESIDSSDYVDLSKCKFTPNAELVLREFYATVKMCNIDDLEANAILKHNMEARNEEAQPKNVAELPTGVLTQAEVLELFKTIDKSKIYRLGEMRYTSVKKIALTILLMMKYPEIIFDLEANATKIFEEVRRDWLKYREHHDTYTEIRKTAIIQHKVVNGYVKYPGVGEIKEDLFVTKYVVLPTEFGTKVLVDHPEFREVWVNALERLCREMSANKIMADYIELID